MRDIKFFVSVIESPHNQSVFIYALMVPLHSKVFSFSIFLFPSQAKRKEGQNDSPPTFISETFRIKPTRLLRPSIDRRCPGGLGPSFQTCTSALFLILCPRVISRSLKYLPTFYCRVHPYTLCGEQLHH